jgi:hypothetical protein
MKYNHNEKSLFLNLLIFVLGSTVLPPVMAQDDLVYVAVEPCRIVDTRNAGGAIHADTSRNFRVSGTATELAVQGGNSDCLDPKAATGPKPLAVSAYVLAVPATGFSGDGVLTAYPSDQLPPAVGKGSTVNFAAGQIVGNTTNITLCDETALRAPPSPCPSDGEFAILARSTDEHVVIDVQGYFYPLDSDSPAFRASTSSYEITASGISTVTFASNGGETDPDNLFDPVTGVFTAPATGEYFFTFSCSIENGNGEIDGVIMGLSINGGSAFNLDNGAFIVVSPGLMDNQPLTTGGVVSLSAGDTVSFLQEGVDSSRYTLLYASFSGFKL